MSFFFPLAATRDPEDTNNEIDFYFPIQVMNTLTMPEGVILETEIKVTMPGEDDLDGNPIEWSQTVPVEVGPVGSSPSSTSDPVFKNVVRS